MKLLVDTSAYVGFKLGHPGACAGMTEKAKSRFLPIVCPSFFKVQKSFLPSCSTSRLPSSSGFEDLQFEVFDGREKFSVAGAQD